MLTQQEWATSNQQTAHKKKQKTEDKNEFFSRLELGH